MNLICVSFIRLDVSLGEFFFKGGGEFELLRESQEVLRKGIRSEQTSHVQITIL